MKKFNTYNGFNVKSNQKTCANGSENCSTHDMINNNVDTEIINNQPIYGYNALSNTDNEARNTVITDVSHPFMEVNSMPENASEYTDYTIEKPVPISMKTRKLLQIAKTHELAIKAILAGKKN